VSELKAFNASELSAFAASQLSARGLGGPNIYTEDMLLDALTLIGGRMEVHYYSGYYLGIFNTFAPGNYQSTSPMITDVKFTSRYLRLILCACYGYNSATVFRGLTGAFVNADTFVEFDPVNDTWADHPGWSTDFPGRIHTNLTAVGGIFSAGQPLADADVGLPVGNYDAFSSTYNSTADVNQPSELIDDFDPTTEQILPKPTFSQLHGTPASPQSYSVQGIVLYNPTTGIIYGWFPFGSPWSLTVIAGPFNHRYGFYHHNERFIKRDYTGDLFS